jgi:hypothetical protein
MWMVFTNQQDIADWQAIVDPIAGFPEPLDRFVQVGGGTHGDQALGRAMHYAEPIQNADGDKWALPFTDAAPAPETCEVVEELPEGWYPPAPEM